MLSTLHLMMQSRNNDLVLLLVDCYLQGPTSSGDAWLGCIGTLLIDVMDALEKCIADMLMQHTISH